MPYQANPAATVNALLAGALANPFGYLGMHGTERGLVVRALLPQARGVSLIDAHGGDLQCELERAGDSGLFTVRLPDRTERFAYRFRIDWGTHEQELEDA
jgi:1,4-alpha-glucan branching enzyme